MDLDDNEDAVFEKYEIIENGFLGEGSYGRVCKYFDKLNNRVVAIKQIKLKNSLEKNSVKLNSPVWCYGIPKSVFYELKIMKELKSKYLIDAYDVFITDEYINVVMPVMKADLKFMLEKRVRYTEAQIKCIMIAIFKGLKILHENWFIHRDLTPGNIFIATDNTIKIADYGLSTTFGGPKKTQMKETVVTLWYRAPELLFNADFYQEKIDIWSVGCIFAELLLGGKPLFNGNNQIDQLKKIFAVLGTPSNDEQHVNYWPEFESFLGYEQFTHKNPTNWSAILPHVGYLPLDLLSNLLMLNPNKRYTAKTACDHKWFVTPPLPSHYSQLPNP